MKIRRMKAHASIRGAEAPPVVTPAVKSLCLYLKERAQAEPELRR